MSNKIQITQTVKSSVNAYLLARAHAETIQEQVNNIEKEILTTAQYFIDSKHTRRGHQVNERILQPRDAWLMSDNEFHGYLIDVKLALIKTGYKIKQDPNEPEYSYQCPALAAENLQIEAEHLLIESAVEMIGEKKEDFITQLLCAGIEKYKQFIDLVVGMVVNLPDFKNPLTN